LLAQNYVKCSDLTFEFGCWVQHNCACYRVYSAH
jgi:hypothetical protein